MRITNNLNVVREGRSLGMQQTLSKRFLTIAGSVALASILAALFVFPVLAKITNKYAIAFIIGNKDYAGHIPSVDFAINDADAFKVFVVDVLGYDPENIIDLRNTTQAQLQSAFGNRETHEGKLWRYLDPKGRSDVTVFYSGHGVPGLKDKRGYLLPVNADPNSPEINGFPLDTLLGNLGKLKAKSVSVFLDACFSGDSQKGMLVRATSGISVTPKMPSRSAKMTIFTAAQGDQVASWDFKSKHGMFTKHLLDALYGKADASGNKDKRVTLSEVRDYLDDNMTRAARRSYGRHQNAWVRGSANTVLASVSTVPKTIIKVVSVEEMDATYVAIKTANLRARPSTKSKIVGSLSTGKSVNVTGKVKSRNWYRLDNGSFVFGSLIEAVDAEDIAAWERIKESLNVTDFRAYLAKFPQGKFADVAKRLAVALEPDKQVATVIVPTKVPPKRREHDDPLSIQERLDQLSDKHICASSTNFERVYNTDYLVWYNRFNQGWSLFAPVIAEAKSRGLSLDQCKTILRHTSRHQGKLFNIESMAIVANTDTLCDRATTIHGDKWRDSKSIHYGFVREARLRGLSLQYCQSIN